MNSLEFIHQVLQDREEMELLFHVEQAIQQRDRLLFGVNARMAEINSLNKEYELLRERYRLLNQRCEHLHVVNNELLNDLRKAKDGGFTEDE